MMEKNQEIVQSGSVNGTMKPNRRAVIVAVWIITMVVLLICTTATRTTVHENGRYHTKKEVALYLYTYKKLPSNYLLKSETEKSGEQPEDGYYIGGDVFRYAKKITEYTEKTDLRECDLDYPENTSRRGQKRLVYAADCSEIFYTDTHYGDDGDPAFVPVKKKDINKTSDIFQAFSIVGAVCGGVYVIYVLAVRKEPASDFLRDAKTSCFTVTKIVGYAVLVPIAIVYLLISSLFKRLKRS